MEITYHRATLEDVDTLVEYRLQFLRERSGVSRNASNDALRKELREYFLKAMAQGTFVAWLAKHEGKVIATSGMVIWKIPPNNSIKNGRLGYILNMYTTPEFRRQGIGTVLLEKMIEEAKFMGLSRVHLHASKLGEGVYRKRGFSEPSDIELVMRLD